MTDAASRLALPQVLIAGACCVLATLGSGRGTTDATGPAHPLEHRAEVDRFAARNTADVSRQGGLVFAGSSNIRLWPDLPGRFAPIPTLNRGYGGARSWEMLHDLEPVVLARRPRVVVYSVGVNDPPVDPDAAGIAERIRAILDRTHAVLPQSRVLYLSIARTPARQKFWPVIDTANRLIAETCTQRPWCTFVDTNPVFVDAAGNADLSLYVKDRQHLTPAAYDRLTAWIRPRVLAAWDSATGDATP